MNEKQETQLKALAIFFFLMSIYLLLFNGVTSTDDEQLYISLTESMAAGRGYSALQLLGNDRLQGSTGSVEPLHSLLGIPLYLFASTAGLGKAQIQFFLSPIYTAAAAAVIYLLLRKRAYKHATSLFCAIAFGMGTIALPYARMHFREPLAALTLVLALYLTELVADQGNKPSQRVIYAVLFFISLGLAVLTKITTAVILPILLVFFIIKNVRMLTSLPRTGNKNRVLVVGVFFFIFFMSSIVFLLPTASLSRFTLRFVDYIRYTLPRLPHDHFWQAIAGLLLSPGKGLFVYSPILLLLLVGPKHAKNRGWMVGFFALLSLTATQAYIYNDEWWGITWGTRALLPVLPLLAVSAAPAMDTLLHSERRWHRYAVYGLMGISVLVQLPRFFTSDPVFVNWATQASGRSVDAAMQWEIALTPIFRYIWLGFQDTYSDLAWLHIKPIHIPALITFITVMIILIAFALQILDNWKSNKGILALSAILLVIGVGSLLVTVREDARYYSAVSSIDMFRDVVCQQASPDDLILVDHYLHPFWWYYSNFGCQHPAWAGLPYLHQTAIHAEFFYPRLPDTVQLISDWLPSSDVFLVTSMQEENVSYQRALSEHGFELYQSADYEPFRMYQIIGN